MPIIPFARWEPVSSHSGSMSAHHGLVLHVQVGTGDCYGEFSVPANQASSTWWVAKDGTLVQYVDSDLIAWTQAGGNSTWNGVETEGYPTEALTNPQILTLARIYVWGHQTYGWPLVMTDDVNGAGFIWHGAGSVAWGNHPNCPGDLRKAQRGAVLYIASLVLAPPTPVFSSLPKEEEMHAVVMPNGDIKVYATGAGDRAGHLLEFTRHDADQTNSVIDITTQIGGSDPFTVQP